MKTKGEKIVKFINGQLHEYTLYKLIDKYNPILKQKAKEFDFQNPPNHPADLAISLAETMGKNGGIGLAAPQVGIPYRVFAMGLIQLDRQKEEKKMNVITLFNPEIIYKSDNKAKALEGCLTFPGMYLEVERPFEIKVRFQNHFGNYMEMTLYGIDARCALHEYDHLDGILFIDRVTNIKSYMSGSEYRKMKK